MRRTLIAGSAVLGLSLAACGSGSNGTAATTAATTATTMTSPATTTTSPAGTTATKDIVDTAVGAGQFKTLASALTAAGLVQTLKGQGPFTVFAPTDAAFAKLPQGTLTTLLKQPMGDLKTILTYHVVPGKVMASDVAQMNGKKVKTVQGGELTVRVDGSKVMLTDATGKSVNVTATDVQASNGVIHVIDGVLMPK